MRVLVLEAWNELYCEKAGWDRLRTMHGSGVWRWYNSA